MAIDAHLPPACAFALSVLAERDLDPDTVPEEAVEAAQLHLATCARCLSSPPSISPPRKKKKPRRQLEQQSLDALQPYLPATFDEPKATSPAPFMQLPATPIPPAREETASANRSVPSVQSVQPVQHATPATVASSAPAVPTQLVPLGPLNCTQCRQLLPEYAEAMDGGQHGEQLYPEVQEHLLTCETGCLVLLDLFRQEAKANRKYRRRPVRDPFSVIGWELSGFFRGGQVPVSPKALAYGTLLLLLLVASLSTYLAIRWDDARYYHPVTTHTIPTPDGIGLSDGLKVFDACNSSGYNDKREAAQALQSQNTRKAASLLASATSAASADTTGCNGGEAAIYHEDLLVRQSGRPYGALIVSFDSGPGSADSQGGTDRHILYAAYTQELIGAYIAQQQYNQAALQSPNLPLLYLILANTTGVEQGALQIANDAAALAHGGDVQKFGLLANQDKGQVPLLGVLGLAPSSLVQVVLPVLCSAGVPLLAPTATGLFIINLLLQTSLYRHCAPGFSFIRFSPDDAAQSWLGANFAYNQLRVRNAAVFYDPSNPSSSDSADGFTYNFSRHKGAKIVARETAVASGLLDSNGRPQASPDVLLSGLRDALSARPRPDLIYAPLLTNDVITLAQDITRLPTSQQPILMIGGEFVHPNALQGFAQWARQQQLTLPRLYVSLIAAARSPDNSSNWQKAFYSSLCTSFAAPGSHCSGAGVIDQGGLLFADSVKMVANALLPVTPPASSAHKGKNTPTPTPTPTSIKLPSMAQLVQRISQERFAGVSSPIRLHTLAGILVTSVQVSAVILDVQEDGSLQIVG